MILHVYSVFDSAVQAYLPPFFERSDASAVRAFRRACLDPNHSFFASSSDFSLYYLGEFDDATGMIRQSGLVFMHRASEMRALPSPDEPR